MVLEEVQDTEPVEVVAKKLLAETVRPYALPGARASVTASIGISIFPDDAADATRADEARRHRHVRREAGGQEHVQVLLFRTRRQRSGAGETNSRTEPSRG